MKPSFAILLLTLAGHALCQDTVSVVGPAAPSGLFSSLTGFLPSFSNLPSLPSLSVGPLPCVGLSTLSAGSCVASDTCAASGGSSDSGCLTSGQVCCIPSLKCGATVAAADAWITNNEYPNSTVLSQNCVYTINKASPVVAQLRIELDSVILAGPSAAGQCTDDRLVVEGVTGINVFPLCGQSNGAHIILPFNGVSLTLRVVVSGVGATQRKWRLHLTQVANNAVAIAPAGCTQLYSADGTLTSLNAGVGGLKYAVCFQKKAGTCGLRLDMSSLIGSQVGPLSPAQATLTQQPNQMNPQPNQMNPQPNQMNPQPNQISSQPIGARLSKRQVDVTAAKAIDVNLPAVPTNVFLPSIVKTNVETASNGDQKATADLFNLQLLNNGLRIGKEVVVQNSLPTPAPTQAPLPAPAPLPVLVQKMAEPKPMTPHYYGGRYYPHSNPAPVYSAPLPAPVPAPVPQKPLIEKAVIVPGLVTPSTPLLQKSLVLETGINGLVGINNNLTATLGNPLLAPLPVLPPAPVVVTALPSLKLQPAGLPVVQTTQPGSVIAGNGIGVSSSVNAGVATNLGATLATGVRARRQDTPVAAAGQNPQLCHHTMFAAPRTIVCLENYSGASNIVLSGGSPYEILYIEAATSLTSGSKWSIPFSFISC